VESRPVSALDDTRLIRRRNTVSNKVVLYNSRLGRFQVSPELPESPVRRARICPMCHQEISVRASGSTDDFKSDSDSFIDPLYFSALEKHFLEQESARQLPGFSSSSGSRFYASGYVTGYYQRFFREIRRLGTGSFGSVYLCSHLIDEIEVGQYAIKKVVLSEDEVWRKRVLREVKALERVQHPCVVAYKHTWIEMARISDFGPELPSLFILMEYANIGNLDSVIWPNCDLDSGDLFKAYNLIEERDIWYIARELLQGLQHLHSHGIIHRDLVLL